MKIESNDEIAILEDLHKFLQKNGVKSGMIGRHIHIDLGEDENRCPIYFYFSIYGDTLRDLFCGDPGSMPSVHLANPRYREEFLVHCLVRCDKIESVSIEKSWHT